MLNTYAAFGDTNIGGSGELGNINTLDSLFQFLWDLTFNIGLGVSMIFIIISGIKIITSAGNDQKLKEGRDTLINAIIGFVIILCFKLIINLVLNIFGSQGVEDYLDDTVNLLIKNINS